MMSVHTSDSISSMYLILLRNARTDRETDRHDLATIAQKRIRYVLIYFSSLDVNKSVKYVALTGFRFLL